MQKKNLAGPTSGESPTCWSYAPHRPDNKAAVEVSLGHTPPPLPWEVDQHPVRMFRDEVRLVTVPHTGVVKTCHKCRGTGGMTCGDCGGKGWVRCLHCHGDVHLPENGAGAHDMDRDRCYYCQHSKHGHGHLECTKCKVSRKMENAVIIKITIMKLTFRKRAFWPVMNVKGPLNYCVTSS